MRLIHPSFGTALLHMPSNEDSRRAGGGSTSACLRMGRGIHGEHISKTIIRCVIGILSPCLVAVFMYCSWQEFNRHQRSLPSPPLPPPPSLAKGSLVYWLGCHAHAAMPAVGSRVILMACDISKCKADFERG